jgi:hypothetical protein
MACPLGQSQTESAGDAPLLKRRANLCPAFLLLRGIKGLVERDPIQQAVVLGLNLFRQLTPRTDDGKLGQHLVADERPHLAPAFAGSQPAQLLAHVTPAVQVHHRRVAGRAGVKGYLLPHERESGVSLGLGVAGGHKNSAAQSDGDAVRVQRGFGSPS